MALAFGIDDVGAYSTSATAFVPIESASGRWSVRAGAGWRSRPGLPLPSDVTEPVPVDDDLRLNTDADHADGFLAVRYNADGGSWLSFSSSGFRAERGIAAELHNDQPRFWRYPEVSRLVAVTSGGTGERRTPFGLGDIEASFGMDLGRTEIDAFDSRAYDTLDGEEDGEDRTYTLRLLADHTLGAQGDLRAAFTYAGVNHDEIIDHAAPDTYRQRLYSVGGETAWRIPGAIGALRGFRVSAGAALDAADTPEAGGKPTQDRISDWGARFGMSAVVNDGDALLHAGISRRARFPALRELYSGALGSFEINPDLTAERLLATEAGVTTKVGQGEFQAVVFHHSLTDAVARIRTPAGKFRRINRNEIRSTGLELLAGTRLGRVSVGGDVTIQSVEVIDPEAGTSVEPEHVPDVFGSLNARAPLFAEIEATAQARYAGRQFCVNPNDGSDLSLDGAGRFDLELTRGWRVGGSGPWFSRIETRVAVDNIADAAIYDQCGMPQPGRTLRFQIRLN
jgi:iron complex outermembrane receptor protein